ncbi:MAG: MBL fold metallo-hydrolase, partial [Microbacterium sp.]
MRRPTSRRSTDAGAAGRGRPGIRAHDSAGVSAVFEWDNPLHMHPADRDSRTMRAETDGVTQVARGVLRIQKAGVNCYLIHTPDGITLIDAGLPKMWPLLEQALESVRARPSDISAIVLTHGHFDHLGMASQLIGEHGTRAKVHPADQRLARHPYR